MQLKSYEMIKKILENEIEQSKQIVKSGETVFFNMSKALAEQKESLAACELALQELIESVEEEDEDSNDDQR